MMTIQLCMYGMTLPGFGFLIEFKSIHSPRKIPQNPKIKEAVGQ